MSELDSSPPVLHSCAATCRHYNEDTQWDLRDNTVFRERRFQTDIGIVAAPKRDGNMLNGVPLIGVRPRKNIHTSAGTLQCAIANKMPQMDKFGCKWIFIKPNQTTNGYNWV